MLCVLKVFDAARRSRGPLFTKTFSTAPVSAPPADPPPFPASPPPPPAGAKTAPPPSPWMATRSSPGDPGARIHRDVGTAGLVRVLGRFRSPVALDGLDDRGDPVKRHPGRSLTGQVGRRHLRVEVVDGRAMWIGVESATARRTPAGRVLPAGGG